MREIKYLIIGAGISGLTCAMSLKEDYLIIEKEERPGGLCKTFYQDGFVWDFAGHFFHFATPELKAFFEQKINPKDMIQCKKDTNINYHGISIDYPFQMNIHQLPREEFIDCLYDLFHRTEKDGYKNFEDMLYGKFGKSITEKFLKPYNEKLYACNLNELDTDAMGRFFPYANPNQIIDNMKENGAQTYNSMFDYPKQGAQFFINLIMKELDVDKVLLNSKVESVDLKRKRVTINGEEIQYKTLINTIPLNHFINLLKENEVLTDIKSSLSCNKVLVFNLGFNKSAVDTATHWTYIPMKDINFYRIGYYNNILNTDKLSMYVEIGFKEDEDIDVDKQLELTLRNLKRLGVITDHTLLSYNVLVINPGYVHITEESNAKVKEFKDMLKKNEAYTIGRYGGWTYCSIEDCMLEARKLAAIL